MGYKHIRDKKYKDALEIFKINVVLHPTSDNVYDSLAEGYLLNNDSLQAYTNFTKALDLNNRNRRAKAFVDAYSIE